MSAVIEGRGDAMTPAEAVLMDDLIERGYTREQVARALVALTLPEPDAEELRCARSLGLVGADPTESDDSAWLTMRAERRGYLPKPGATP